ncbi:MAG: hypothetical protein O6922_07555 [Chloroflexi bacterium]|nr:hypothetical protein [Chloroflexota bacterium]
MPNLAQLLTTKSSVEQRRIFDLCRELSADVANFDGVYVVGGVVRDLVLGRKPGDVDISVVGDAEVFSRSLASGLGAGRPAKSEFLTFKIVVGGDGPSTIDIVTARSETYPEPGALPVVVPSPIEHDLRRRDFTVNSMAISLSNSSWGNLVDPANGFGDIMRKRIRVLHDSSFEDDPTRMFRAVRYATRLDFSIDERTQQLISNSLRNVDRLSGARVLTEFELILGEPKNAEMLGRAEEYGLLSAISPGLRIGSKSLDLLEAGYSEEISDIRALISYGLTEGESQQIFERFDRPGAWSDPIFDGPRLAALAPVLDRDDIKRSEIHKLLHAFSLPSIRAYIAAGAPLPRRGRMVEYMDKIRFEEPEITGDDLIAAGIPEGPVIGKLIDLVTRARLDGQVKTKEEELALAKSRVPGFLAGQG